MRTAVAAAGQRDRHDRAGAELEQQQLDGEEHRGNRTSERRCHACRGPAASRVFRSIAVVFTIWPSSEPSAPPVAMIGPSAPNGPPVPMEIAALTGLSSVTRGGMRLSLRSTCSIASGIPCPRMAFDP
jgi:hypothetical protein